MGRAPVGHPRSPEHQGSRVGHPPRFGPPEKTWRIWCGDSERLGKMWRIWSGGPPSAGRTNPPLPPPSIPWPWRCWWPRCGSSPPGDFLPLPTASHIVAIPGTIAAQWLSGVAGLSSLLVTQPAPTVMGGSEARPQRTPEHRPKHCNLHRPGRWRRCPFLRISTHEHHFHRPGPARPAGPRAGRLHRPEPHAVRPWRLVLHRRPRHLLRHRCRLLPVPPGD